MKTVTIDITYEQFKQLTVGHSNYLNDGPLDEAYQIASNIIVCLDPEGYWLNIFEWKRLISPDESKEEDKENTAPTVV